MKVEKSITAPIKTCIVAEQQPQNTNGGTNIAGNNLRTLNIIENNNIPGAALTTVGLYIGKGIDLPVGNYVFNGKAPAGAGTGTHRLGIFIYDQNDNQLVSEWCEGNSAPGVGENIAQCAFAYIATVPIRVVLVHYITTAVLNTGLGVPVNQAGIAEHYSELVVQQLGGSTPVTTIANQSIDITKLATSLLNIISKTGNGYWKDAQTGFIVQWGSAVPASNLSGTVTSVVFPVVFPNSAAFVGCQIALGAVASNSNFVVSTSSVTGFSVIRENSGNLDGIGILTWIAVGY